jgi:hypothetical protein
MLLLRSLLALALFCALLCAGQFLLACGVWALGAIGANELVYPLYGLGSIALFPLSFVLAGRLAQHAGGGRRA